MNKLSFVAAATALAAVTWASPPVYEYEGEWGGPGSGNGQFNDPTGINVATDGTVYVADQGNGRIQYFTPTGSFLGLWNTAPFQTGRITIAADGKVYTAHRGISPDGIVACFTPTGLLLGSWAVPNVSGNVFSGLDVAPDGIVFVATTFCTMYHDPTAVYRYNSSGSLLCSWPHVRTSKSLAVSPNSNFYAADPSSWEVHYYTSTGSYLGKWGKYGIGRGEFENISGIDVTPDLRVFVVDLGNSTVQYFTATGSFLGWWGSEGSGPSEFKFPYDLAVSHDGARVYVADTANQRIQYFRVVNPAVAPASLGRVKALFR